MRVSALLYGQHDADLTKAVPAEGFAGWFRREVDLAPDHTALVVMHAWDAQKPGAFPGWDRCVEYRPRARRILADVFPRLLAAVRASPLPVFHVVGGRDYYRNLPGYRRAESLAGESPPVPPVEADPAYERLQAIRRDFVHPGVANAADVDAGFAQLDFAPEARPVGDEGIAENASQLAALCRAHGINHLIYTGFALNWCLLMSPGGMADMARHGCLCSTLPEAVTAVENAETARTEHEKAQALWRVAVAFGFVFPLDDFLAALPVRPPSP
jgi:nicotinamidase-related amidase